MIIVSDNYVQHPKVSVVILTYNQENFIAQAIESIICQETTFPYEIIIGEDCSTDTTRDICLSYQNKYPQLIKLILQEKNLGLIGNYKSVLSQCRGEYIAECGGDDYWCDENKLQKHIDYMDEHDDVVVTYHDAKTVDVNSNLIKDSFLPQERKINFTTDELKKALLLLPQTMCFRTIVVNEIIHNLSSHVYNEDLFVTSIMGNYGTGVYLSNIKNTAYRILKGSVWMGQTSIKRTLMAIGSNSELKKYYDKRNDEYYAAYFRKKVIALFADVPIRQLKDEEKVLFLTLLKRYFTIVGLKNSLHYLKTLYF